MLEVDVCKGRKTLEAQERGINNSTNVYSTAHRHNNNNNNNNNNNKFIKRLFRSVLSALLASFCVRNVLLFLVIFV